jgi:[glutamine synthetase] adenylyltransferase / [glutamine synthetase]-adenylyl-L-tyrosine phosphorylase
VESLDDLIERSADPGVARAVLERLSAEHPSARDRLERDHQVAEACVSVIVASRSLANAIVIDPTLLDAFTGDQFVAQRSVDDYREAARNTLEDGSDPPSELRRWKRLEIARTAGRDLVGRADLVSVGRELAALAEVCLGVALDVAAPQVPFAIIGMGKLGGSELNYSSDVDVLFVHDGDAAEAERAAKAVLSVMTDPTPDGIVFRTDTDLRPEGRSGPITRSLDSYAAYYERWAQTWEFQALLKARPVAGDAQLGARFVETVAPLVWPDALDPDAVREVRAMKERSESEMRRLGLDELEVKRGRGGIRDIEFAVQLLQLVHGRHDTAVRSPTTLRALEQLAVGGYVNQRDSDRLTRAYTFLRTVEHRLQLHADQQTHTLPTDRSARERLARILGYRDRGDASAGNQFESAHRAWQAEVRSIHERLFFAPILETLAGASGALPLDAAEERLAAFGFIDVAQIRPALRELATGLTRRSKVMQQLLPVMLEWLSSTPDPDLGLLQLRRLTEGPARSAAVANTFREMPGAARRTCVLLGSSRLLGDSLRRHPEFIELLGDDMALAVEKTRDALTEEAIETLEWREDVEARRAGLRRFKRRELLRIASRDVLGFAGIESTERELACLGESCLEGALSMLEPDLPFAVIGMGRLGGAELSYASDIDVLFVYDGSTASDFNDAEQIATDLMREIGATTAEGQTFRIDADLRPEGKDGPLTRSLESYRQYYEQWALPWELQALIKARPVAGDMELAERFIAMIEPFVYREPFPEDDIREIRRMKARIERERIPPGEDPQFHLKLGPGALSDVEFTVQLLQLCHGPSKPAIRETSTMGALSALTLVGLVSEHDAEALAESYRFCERARNARYLLTSAPGDSLPSTPVDAERIALLLGYVHRPQASLRDDYRRVTRRARKVVERVFYANAG